MVMPWFLPIALGVGVLSTKTCVEYRREPGNARQKGGAWLLLFMGWVPFVAWLVNNLWRGAFY